LLPYSTEFQAEKRYRHGRHTLAPLSGFWGPLSGVAFDAYQIRHGETRAMPASSASALRAVADDHCGWQHGQTLALYLHGMLESPVVMHALFGSDAPTLDDTLNGLADFVDRHFEEGALMSLLA
jgi:adenosylcobyric acid synthase